MRVWHLLGAAIVWATAAQSACVEDRLELRGEWGTARFRVEVADDAQERARGLMFRDSMAATAGMLFIYERPQRVAFWMRNTLIPLDMVFMDDTGTVQSVHVNAVPLDETPIFGGDNIQYVLEVNGGLTEQLGITVGSEMRHPGLVQDLAAWPCEQTE